MLPACRTNGEGFTIPTFDLVPSDVEGFMDALWEGCGSFATMPRTLISVSPYVLCCHESFPPTISCNVGRAVGISANFAR
jgi:hypothetical protein